MRKEFIAGCGQLLGRIGQQVGCDARPAAIEPQRGGDLPRGVLGHDRGSSHALRHCWNRAGPGRPRICVFRPFFEANQTLGCVRFSTVHAAPGGRAHSGLESRMRNTALSEESRSRSHWRPPSRTRRKSSWRASSRTPARSASSSRPPTAATRSRCSGRRRWTRPGVFAGWIVDRVHVRPKAPRICFA